MGKYSYLAGKRLDLDDRIAKILRSAGGGLTAGVLMNRLRPVPQAKVIKTLDEMERDGRISAETIGGRFVFVRIAQEE